ncbi:MAG: Nuclease SbcCD subunit C [Bacteroidetes bacterium ADurb.Bin217]|nr:MAG: Nuclease SbcCD subunit C [Bacteroidetes bacterium ADurb.Bin217]
MIPISITLQGFYSYKEKQTIDFTNLTKAGVFGIFGATGSGKSAIIEAIMFALYGETERLNNREDRSYNFMNLQSNELYIEFICFSHFTQTQYTIQVQAKRSSKNFEQVSSLKRTCYKYVDNTWIPIGESVIQTEVTGLSYTNFKHTVIIPQGTFMDFLQLSPTERTAMLKNIFDLHAFELQDKVKQIEAATLDQITFIQGNLQEIGEIDSELVTQLELQEQQLLAKGIDQKKQLDELQTKLQNLVLIEQQINQLKHTTETLNQLHNKAQEYKNLEVLILNIATCIQHIAPIYDLLTNKQRDVKGMLHDLELTVQQAAICKSEFEIVQSQFVKIESDYNNRDEYQQHTKQLQIVLEVKKNEQLLCNIDSDCNKFSDLITSYNKSLQELNSSYDEISAARKSLLESIPDISVVYAKKQELEAYHRICKNIEDCREKRISCNASITDLQHTFCNKVCEVTGHTIAYNDAKSFIQESIELCKKQLQHIENQLQQALLQKHIEDVRLTLKSGTPCPVCGAMEHSLQNTVLFDSNMYTTILEQKEQCLQQISDYSNLLTIFENTHTHISLLKKQDSEVSHSMHSLTIERNLNEPDFEQRDVSVFEAQIQEIAKQQATIKTYEEQLARIDSEKKCTTDSLQQLQLQLSELQTSRIQLQTRIVTHKESVQPEIFESYKSYSIDSIENEYSQRITHSQKIISLFETEKLRFEENKQKHNSFTISILEKEKNISAIREDIEVLEQKLLFAIKSQSFSSIEQVAEVLKHKDNLLAYSQKLEQYKHEVKQTTELQAKLSVQLQNIAFNPQELIEIQESITKSEIDIQQTRDAYVRINEQIKTVKIKLDKYLDFQKQLSVLRNDLDNILVCKSLFKQSGFVMYMSTRYLHMICERANQRFTHLTKHALQLEVVNNSFIVRDFLNNGKVRHIKTLSGGQAFQAALSLALALSESVQMHTPNISNFFFIDEGFGSQDKESLTTVFETLRSLQHEGKIVGIISHVDEIKENIPVYIQIINSNGTSKIL